MSRVVTDMTVLNNFGICSRSQFIAKRAVEQASSRKLSRPANFRAH